MTDPAQDTPISQAPVIITGMSGAGLSTAARVMEDMGWYTAQNLPYTLMVDLVEKCRELSPPINKVAVVTDVRSRDFGGDLTAIVKQLQIRFNNPTLLFLDARDDVLVRRFDSVRRTHPLQGSGTLQTGISRERELLAPVKEMADLVINTSELSLHDLRRVMQNSFATLANQRQHITVQSFGFKHGAPTDADIVVDVRFLPNPYWVPELRLFRGTDAAVSDYVLQSADAQQFVQRFVDMLQGMMAGYRREGKSFVSVGVGCTGGHHRSVAVAEELAKRLQALDGIDVTVMHRDISRG
ncbi:glmZ(sRNA)-inactivating NTPase [Corynebacterium choanae]|uniref:GlmZ(SRNA)-inactivating NTPase n=2 Tax=Corynebacterium choanae TaxID=1862358 RepID=A0A3G6J739_9CORY|nr:RNase adapter RapZ [Corynebacterium choanae]AZA13642.1 glmZ(sRNA)-inactivating NTPase [Corynebacterium choanae]